MLEQIDHGHHVLRAYAKDAVARMFEKFSTFLRVEVCVNRLKDFGLNFVNFEASALNVHVDFPLFQRIALGVVAGKSKVPGIKIHDTRMLRLMEILCARARKYRLGQPRKFITPSCRPSTLRRSPTL